MASDGADGRTWRLVGAAEGLRVADDYGNGVVWAGNRKGMGRELKPGP